jgi:DNA-binding NtrC family response regulator
VSYANVCVGDLQSFGKRSAAMTLRDLRAFLAEDEPVLLMELEENLADMGCKVVATAARVSEALELLARHEFDTAILDVRLKDSSSEPVGDALVTRGIPFIIATGDSSTELARRFPNAPVLNKPYSVDDLRKALLLVKNGS